jgi:ribosomal-protein-alanine N-acetyltransferase
MTFKMQGDFVGARFFEPQDLEAVQDYLNHPDLAGRRYLPEGDYPAGLPLSKKMVAEILDKWSGQDRQLHLAVSLPGQGDLIGHASAFWRWDPLCPHVELVISPVYQRRGFGSEALVLLVKWLFDNLPANSISANAAEWNQAGCAFLLKRGFKPAGRERSGGMWGGNFFDMLGYDMLREEWYSQREGGHGA